MFGDLVKYGSQRDGEPVNEAREVVCDIVPEGPEGFVRLD